MHDLEEARQKKAAALQLPNADIATEHQAEHAVFEASGQRFTVSRALLEEHPGCLLTTLSQSQQRDEAGREIHLPDHNAEALGACMEWMRRYVLSFSPFLSMCVCVCDPASLLDYLSTHSLILLPVSHSRSLPQSFQQLPLEILRWEVGVLRLEAMNTKLCAHPSVFGPELPSLLFCRDLHRLNLSRYDFSGRELVECNLIGTCLCSFFPCVIEAHMLLPLSLSPHRLQAVGDNLQWR